MNFGVLVHKNFRLLFIARTLSTMGNRITPIALSFAILEMTGDVGDLGIVLAAKTTAMIIFLLIGGVVSDKLPRKQVLVSTELLRVFCQSATAIIIISGTGNIWMIVVLQFIAGIGQGFFRPASTGLLPTLLEKKNLQEANALISISENTMTVVGAAIAGVLVALLGAGWAIAVDALTFLIAASCILGMSVKVNKITSKNNILKDLQHGWEEFRTRKWLVVMVIKFSVFHLTIWAPLFVLGPEISETGLEGASSWAILMTFFGIGNVLGGGMALKIKLKLPLFISSIFFIPQILPLLGLAFTTNIIILGSLFVVSGVAGGFMNAIWDTTMQKRVPTEILSRVSSYDWFASMIFLPVGYSLIGPAKSIASNEQILTFGSLIFLVLVLLLLRTIKKEDLDYSYIERTKAV